MSDSKYESQVAIHTLWSVGDLSYKLHATQELMRNAVIGSRGRLSVLNCARRLGKSYLCCVLAVEQCLQHPGCRVPYAAPTAKQVRTIITPIMRDVLMDAPEEFRPTFHGMDGIWSFPNGSEIHVVGVNNEHADDLRGGNASLVIVDEAGMIDDLEYLLESVVKPMLLVTDGRIVVASTPASTPAHSFTRYCAIAQLGDSYAEFTLFDAPHISRERAEEFIEEGGGRSSTAVRREYFCEHVVDTTHAVLPEFDSVKEAVVQSHPRPKYFTPMIVLDVGFTDLSAAVFGYHDFSTATDVIEGGWSGEGKRAIEIVEACDKLAIELWGEEKAKEALRYADTQPITLAELSASGQEWRPVVKTQTDGHFKAAATNDLRTRLAQKSIRIDPSCADLVAHCRYAVWRVPGRDLARMDGYGHFDYVDALMYFVRLVDRHTNPTPILGEGVTNFTHWIEESVRQKQRDAGWAKLGSRRR